MVQLTVPYCTAAELAEFPTFLDFTRVKKTYSSTLDKILLTASTWVDSYVDMDSDGTLTAHTTVENKRMRPDRWGRLRWHPDHAPFISLESLSYGYRLGSLTTWAAPVVFVEDERNVTVDMGAQTSQWTGSLQFGFPRGGEVYTTFNYTAGYVNTVLTSGVVSGATVLPVADVTGMQPGQTLRIYDPGSDENVTIASTWVQTTGPGTVPIVTGLVNPHQIPHNTRLSAMGNDIFEATMKYAIATLMRPDAYPDMYSGLTGHVVDNRMTPTGLVEEAKELLSSLRRVI